MVSPIGTGNTKVKLNRRHHRFRKKFMFTGLLNFAVSFYEKKREKFPYLFEREEIVISDLVK